MATRIRQHGRCRGFTLLEVLVAVGILGLVAVIAYGSLSALTESKRGIEQHTSRLADLQLAFQLMQRDLAQAVPRDVRDELGGLEKAMVSVNGELAFTRVGEDLPPQVDRPRSRLERLQYQLRGEELWRVRWRQLDRVQGTRADEMRLLDEVKGWKLRFLGRDGDWQQSWPVAAEVLPAAVEIELEHASWGALRRLLLVNR